MSMFPVFISSYYAHGIQAQLRRIEERETLIRSIGTKHNLKGFDHSPLEREKVIEFVSRLSDLQRRQNVENERLQVSSHLYPSPDLHHTDATAGGKPYQDGSVQCCGQEAELRVRSVDTTKVDVEEPDCKNPKVLEHEPSGLTPNPLDDSPLQNSLR